MSARDWRPGPAITGPACRIHDGSGVLRRRFTGWLWPKEPTLLRTAGRVSGTAFGASMVWTAVQASPRLMWVLAGGWLIAAYRAEPDGKEPAADPDGVTDAEFVELVRTLAGDGPGVHLAEIAEGLARVEPGRKWDTADVRQFAERLGLEVVSTRSRTRSGSSTGIRTKDLPPPPPPPVGDPDGVVVPGQPSDNDNDDITVERIGEGSLIARDPATAARPERVRGQR